MYYKWEDLKTDKPGKNINVIGLTNRGNVFKASRLKKTLETKCEMEPGEEFTHWMRLVAPYGLLDSPKISRRLLNILHQYKYISGYGDGQAAYDISMLSHINISKFEKHNGVGPGMVKELVDLCALHNVPLGD